MLLRNSRICFSSLFAKPMTTTTVTTVIYKFNVRVCDPWYSLDNFRYFKISQEPFFTMVKYRTPELVGLERGGCIL